jgi:meiotic recombination protein REC8
MHFDLPNVGEGMVLEDLPGSSSLSAARSMHSSFIMSHEAEEVVAVPLHRGTKPRKPILLDQSIEYRMADTKLHDTGYLRNMIAASRERLNRRLHHQARNNAEHFILGKGLNGIGTNLHPNITNPLAMFSGKGLYEWIFGAQEQKVETGTKRSSSDDEASNSRRVRARTDELDPASFDDAEAILRMDDDVEVARQAGTDLEDVSSVVMPWTVSASKRGSSVSRFGVGSTTRRSRLVSASPLQNRGAAMAPLDEINFQVLDDRLIPGTYANDQEATDAVEDKRIEAALDKDGDDFIVFIAIEIALKQASEEQLATQLEAEAKTVDSISFEELMAPNVHPKQTAARGFLVVCSLATKNLIRVKQNEHFGGIIMSLV